MLESKEINLDALSVLENIVEGKEILKLRPGTSLFSQGEPSTAIYFIQSGQVKVTIAWVEARDSVLAILGPGDFFGEGCLVGQRLQVSTATTMKFSAIVKIQKHAMLQAFQAQPRLSEKFIAALLVRNIDLEQDICSQLFNSAEKRLARVLLKLDRFGRPSFLPDGKLSQLSHGTLADLVGTTRAQIVRSLKKFRRLGLIHYNGSGEIVVRAEMVADIVLHA